MSIQGKDYSLRFFSINHNRQVYDYVVIVAFFKDKLVWVRQKGKFSWEIPGGHVEKGESVDEAARREFVEETGAISFEIQPLCDFEIAASDNSSYNRLYFAEVFKMSNSLGFETEEVKCCNSYPFPLTHGSIQPMLIDEAKRMRGFRKF